MDNRKNNILLAHYRGMRIAKTIGIFLHHVTQLTSIALAFVWFGWKAGLIVFLINWALNTEYHTR